MTWEANQNRIDAQAYSEEIVNCILREFQANQEPAQNLHVPPKWDNLYNYPCPAIRELQRIGAGFRFILY